ncbi:MAG: ORF6N domain-containing protein [Chitinophagaceae bacterium]|nr:ORF6N domain-containing protein [Chitinophagaceae bacterium]
MQLTAIQTKIYEIRGSKVMLDFDLAELYEVETKAFNQAVKRNKTRFPVDFMFRLNKKEWETMRSQFVTAAPKRNISAAPYAFTEHGVTMLASVLRSERAVRMNISIVRAFIGLRQVAMKYKEIANQIAELRDTVGEHSVQLNQIYEALENLLDEKVSQAGWEDRERIGFKSTKK